VLTAQRVRCGRFILATNVLDAAVLSAADALREYKAQQGVERGFRFLKDPLFFADSVFLKSPKRIAALGMIMALCLLLYNLGQRQLRQALAQQDETIPNQLGKPTSSPTLRWVFQCFMAVHLVVFQGVRQVVNLTNERLHILQFFSPACRRYYLLSSFSLYVDDTQTFLLLLVCSILVRLISIDLLRKYQEIACFDDKYSS
jgi:hypothetical protein